MKKHIFAIITLSLLVFSCTKYDEPEYTGSKYPDGSILFSTVVQDARASVMSSSTLQVKGEQFQVMAFYKNEDTYSKYFSSTVTYSGTEWEYDNVQLWPNTGDMKFYACYPYYCQSSWYDITDHDDLELTYSCPAGLYDQIDLLVASQQESRSDLTNISFEHALSQISFKVQFVDETNIYLQSIDVEYDGDKFVRQGRYNFSTESWNLDEVYFPDDNGLDTTTINYSGQISEKGDVRTVDGSLMILPQEITDDSKITVRVNYYILNFGDGVIGEFNPSDESSLISSTPISISASLPSVDGTNKYEMGKHYTYTLAIENKEISIGAFTVDGTVTTDDTYGNIYLSEIEGLTSYENIYENDQEITDFVTYLNSVIAYNDYDTDTEVAGLKSSQYYYTSAYRVRRLLNSGVRDFILVGNYEASEGNNFGVGKLGFWGGSTSPFNIAVQTSDEVEFNNSADLFSVDLRNVTGFPEFRYAHTATESDLTISTIVEDLDDSDPVVPTGMFYYVLNLKEVILPTEVMAIDKDAFAGCNNLETIDIQNVIHLESGALTGCSALTHINNGKLTRVHDYAAQLCENLKHIDLSLTEEVDDYAFSFCSNLTDVNLSLLRSVGDHAFSDCFLLSMAAGSTSPKLEGLVGAGAFNGCSYLGGDNEPTFDLSATTSIGASAFFNCTELELEQDMSKVTDIGSNAFQGCSSIGNIDLSSIITVDISAFNMCTSLTLEPVMSNLTTIADYAFEGCKNIEEITISNLESLGKYAFTYCEKLQLTATEDDGITYKNDNLTTISEHAFNNCSSINNYFVFNNATSAGEFAFAGCSSLLGLTMNNLTEWDAKFFAYCTSMKTLSLEKVVTNTVIKNFYNDDNSLSYIDTTSIISLASGMASTLEHLDLSNLDCGQVPAWSFVGAPELSFVDMAAATSIGNGAFFGCAKLTGSGVNFSGAETIGDQAFADCTALSSISLPKAISIGSSAFAGCSLLSSLDLPLTETIGDEAFSNCTALKTLDLPKVTSVGSNFVNGIGTALQTIEMPELTDITNVLSGITYDKEGGEYYKANDQLTELRIPKAAGSIGYHAMTYFSKLKIADLSGITSLGYQSMQGCDALEELYLADIQYIQTYSYPFAGCTSIMKLDLQSLVALYSDLGDVFDPAETHYDIFNDIPELCQIKLSQEQYNKATISDGTYYWAGRYWGKILLPTDDFDE